MSEEKKNDAEILDSFLEEIQDDLKINDLDLREECRTAANKTQKYIEHYYDFKRKLRKLDVHLKKVEGELFHKYKYEFEINLSSSADVQKFIQKDKRYITALTKYNEYETIVDMMEKIVRNFQSRNYTLNKMVDIERLQ